MSKVTKNQDLGHLIMEKSRNASEVTFDKVTHKDKKILEIQEIKNEDDHDIESNDSFKKLLKHIKNRRKNPNESKEHGVKIENSPGTTHYFILPSIQKRPACPGYSNSYLNPFVDNRFSVIFEKQQQQHHHMKSLSQVKSSLPVNFR